MLLPLNKRKNSHSKQSKSAINSLVENSSFLSVKKVFKNKYSIAGFLLTFFLIILILVIYNLSFFFEEKIDDYDFSKGVLSLNTDKSEYVVGETVLFQMGSLDKNGDTLCKSNLQLEISVPNVERKTILSYDKKQIVITSTCKEDNNITNDPDYVSRFKAEKAGEYNVLLTNLDTGKKVRSKFKVVENTQFNISRNSATRINPFKSDRYPMIIEITSTKDFKGKYVEYTPKNFQFAWKGAAKIEENKDYNILTWDLELKAGETKKLTYEYTAPKKSPDFIRYGLGELVTSSNVVYKEVRAWQIASDATITTGGSGNWSSTSANAPWPGGTIPATTDNIVVANGHTLTVDGNRTAVNITINAGGTLTFSNTPTLTLTGTPAIANSGTYTRNGETITLTSNAATTATSGTVALQNLTIAPAATASRVYSLGAGLSINGNFTVAPTGSGNFTVTARPGATLVVGGTITLTSVGASNNRAILDAISGTNRNITAASINIGANSTYTPQASTFTLTGTSGTLFTRSGTFTQSTSTVQVTSASGTPTLNSGTITFNNLTINSAATSITLGAAITLNAAGNLNIAQGTLIDNGNQITCTATCTGRLTLASGTTLSLGSSSAATTFPANYSTFTIDAASTVVYQGNAAQTISRTPSYGNLTFAPALSADRTYSFAAGAATVNGDFNISPASGAFKLLVNLNGTLTVGSTKTLTIQNSSGTAELNQVANTSTISTGFLNIGTNGTLTMITTGGLTLTGISGTLFTKTGTFTQATSTLTVSSASGPVQLFSAATTVYNLTINSASSSTVVNSGATPTFASSGSLTVTSGVLNFDTGVTGPGASGTLTLGSSGTLCLGGTAAASNTSATCDTSTTSTVAIGMPTFQTYTFNSSSTVRYLSNADTTISNTPNYGNLYLTPKITTGRNYNIGGALTISGDTFQANPYSASLIVLSINMAGDISVPSTGTITLSGTNSAMSSLVTKPSSTSYNVTSGFINITAAGMLDATSASSTITLNGTSGTLFTNSGTFFVGTSTVVFNPNATSITLTSGTFSFYNMTLSPTLTTGRAYSMGSGNLSFNGDFLLSPTGSGVLTVSQGGNISGLSTKTMTIGSSATFQTGAGNPTLGFGNISISSGGTLNGTGSTSVITVKANGTPFTVTGTYTAGSTTIVYNPASTSGVDVASTTYNNVTFNKASNTFTLSNSIVATGNLTITAGTLNVSGSNFPITVGGDWVNTPGGSSGFYSGYATVTFNTATTSNIYGDNTFYNFTSTTAGKTIKFEQGKTTTINGALTLTGSSGPSYVTLDSINGSSQWTINHQGTESITYASITNSACDASSTQISVDDGTSYDGGNNGTCWKFPVIVNSAYFKLDEAGDNVYDSISNSMTGALAGTTKPSRNGHTDCVSGGCLYFDGSTSKVTFSGSIASVKTISFWAKPYSTTSMFIQLTSSAYIQSSGGTLFGTGISSPVFYVNGIKKSTISSNEWQFITVTTTSAISANAVVFGNHSSTYYKGYLDEVRLDSTTYTESQVKADYTTRGGVDTVSAQFSPDSAALSSNIVGYWKFDENTGTSTTDSSLYSQTGTLNTGPTWQQAKFASGVQFDGVDDDISVGTNSVLNIANNITIGAWIYPTGWGENNVGTIFSRQSGSGAGYQFTLVNSSSEQSLRLSNGSTVCIANTGSVSLNSWQYVSVIVRNNQVTFFVNGVAVSGGCSYNLAANGAITAYIGSKDGNADTFTGIIDDLRVYNVALDTKLITALYKYAPGPVGYWNFDEGSGTSSVQDVSGNSNVGALSGITNSNWVPGKFGSGLQISNNTQYATVGTPSSLTPTELSYSAWVRRDTSLSGSFIMLFIAKTNWNDPNGWTLSIDDLTDTGTSTNRCINFSSMGVNLSGYNVDPDSCFPVGVWTHVEVTYSSSHALTIYLNGVPVPITDFTGRGDLVSNTATKYLFMGDDSGTGTVTIDDVKLYNYVRTPAQVIEDMNGGHPVGGSPVGSQVGYWKFDDVASNSAKDTTINSNTLSLCNATDCSNTTAASWTGDGRFGGAWNGTGSVWLYRADDSDFDFSATDDFTISGWFKSDSASNPASTEYLVNKASASAPGYALYFNTSGQVCFGIDDDTSWNPDVASCSATDYYDGTWHSFIAVRDTVSDQLKLYVDSSLKDFDADTTTATLANSLPLYVGDRDGADNGSEFNGGIDELKFYRAALSESQVKIEYNRASSVKFGTTSTTSTPSVSSDSLNREFCLPGDSATCSSPLVYMKFDENTGTSNTYDSSGHGFTATMNGFGTGAWVPGKLGSALSFDGSNDYVDITDNGTLVPTSAVTISAWVNFRQLASTKGEPQRVIRKLCTTAPCSSNSTYALEFNNSADSIRFTIFVGGSNVYVRSQNNALSLNTWYHIAGVYDSAAGIFKVYINGVDVSSFTSGTPSGDLQGDSGGVLRFGANSSTSNRTDGLIDEVKVYNYARSNSQLMLDYNRGKPSAWFRFDEGSGTNLYDSMGNVSTGTLSSGSWTSNPRGVSNQAVYFGGYPAYASFPNNSVFCSPTQTISVWFNIDSYPVTDYDEVIRLEGNNGYQISYVAGGAWDVGFKNNSGTSYAVAIPSTDIPAGTWVHLTMTMDGSYTNVYLNGKFYKRTSFTGSRDYSCGTNNLYVGAYGTTSFVGRNYIGKVDDIKIFNYALTPRQVLENYNSGTASFK